jgi:hypothetical protein
MGEEEFIHGGDDQHLDVTQQIERYFHQKQHPEKYRHGQL